MKTMIWMIVAAITLLAIGVLTDGVFNGGLVKEAGAVRGMPVTPRSYAGVARQTTRHVIRRTDIYVTTLPVGCSTVVIEGVTLHQCGAAYYQPVGAQYVVVDID